MVREDEPDDKRLVAYVVPAKGRQPVPSELRGFLREELPDYMVPSAFVVMESLPLTPNGKVDRKALPTPEGERQLCQVFVPPESGTERRIAAIWRDVLRVQKIGVHDNFFELGGHSLLATQLTSRLCDTFSLDLPLRCVFEYPTVASLATYIDALCCVGTSAEESPAQGASAQDRGEV